MVDSPSSLRAATAAPPELAQRIATAIRDAGGWIPFDAYMQRALYEPGLGYYARQTTKFGRFAEDGSDFVTAPELSPLFARALARQLAETLQATGTQEIWEFGAGSGALALGLLQELARLDAPVRRYTIVDVSGALRMQQAERLKDYAKTVAWANTLPTAIQGVVIGNEVLDAMPVKLLARRDGAWHERGVALDLAGAFTWADQTTDLRPPVEIEGDHDYVTEIHPQAEAFIRTLGERLKQGAAFFIDYGFPEAEYYHPQRAQGTLVCHHAHRMDDDPLADVGAKDITAHVNFTGIGMAANEVGLALLGYTSQGRFLLNCDIAELMDQVPTTQSANAMKLIAEHEMGELFKVIAMAPGDGFEALGFATGDRTHRL